MSEIENRYPSQWILVGDPETNAALKTEPGGVLFHSKDRDEVYREAARLRPKRFSVLFTGVMPQDTAIVL